MDPKRVTDLEYLWYWVAYEKGNIAVLMKLTWGFDLFGSFPSPSLVLFYAYIFSSLPFSSTCMLHYFEYWTPIVPTGIHFLQSHGVSNPRWYTYIHSLSLSLSFCLFTLWLMINYICDGIYVGDKQDTRNVMVTHDPLPPSPESPHQAAEWQDAPFLELQMGVYENTVDLLLLYYDFCTQRMSTPHCM